MYSGIALPRFIGMVASRLSRLRGHKSAWASKSLRREMTDPEMRLWYRLRAGRFDGWKFRRQVPLGDYVVDFLCENARLIVEIDGGQHADQQEDDLARTRWLEQQGYRVMRFWNNEVLENMDGVLETLFPVLASGKRGKT
jgi:very-short-patch-repair endonuclease